MGLSRQTPEESIETACHPYAPTETLDLHTPRFGGPQMSELMLDGLGVSGDDRIVEIWPGFGGTTRRVLSLRPRWYRGIAANHDASARLDRELRRAPDLRTLVTHLEAEGVYTGFSAAPPEATGLEDGSANVVFGESLLTPLDLEQKRSVIKEAARLLTTGGRLGIHELCLIPNPSWDETRDMQRADEIRTQLRETAGSQLQPMFESEWHRVIEESGLVVTATRTGPVEVPTLGTLRRDVGSANFLKGTMGRIRHFGALQAVRELSYVLQRNSEDLGGVVIVAQKPLIGDLLLPER